nr:MAG TPA: hypothetical protein [Caudoviricetes sp.]
MLPLKIKIFVKMFPAYEIVYFKYRYLGKSSF